MFSSISNLETKSLLSQNVDQYTGAKWFIHDSKHHDDKAWNTAADYRMFIISGLVMYL